MRGALTWIVGGAVAVLLIVAIADGVRSRADASGSEAPPPRALRGLIVTADSACQTKAYRFPSMGDLAEQLLERYDLCAVAITHRVGICEIGEPSVAIAVSAPHRRDALAACKDAIDTLKETVPLWKKEVYEGGEEWIGRGS